MRFRSRALSLVLFIPLAATLVSTSRYIIQENDFQPGDQYVAANAAIVEGTVDGDLAVATSEIFVSGLVEGDLDFVANGNVTITGTVTGSLRGITTGEVVVAGEVSDDIVVAAGAVDISGVVGGDVVVWSATTELSGDVGRDVRGQMLAATISGQIGRDVDISVQDFTVTSSAVIDGDLIYRSNDVATVSAGADIAGQNAHLTAQFSFFVRVVFAIATLLSFLAFLAGGLGLFVVFRSTTPRAATFIALSPLRAAVAGLGFVLLLPVLAAMLATTLVGIPLALLGFVMLVLVLIFGPVPAYAALGERLLRGRGGLIGGFLAVAVVWRLLLWLVPTLGLGIYLVALVVGSGGWLIGGWELRRDRPAVDVDLPAAAGDVGGRAGDRTGDLTGDRAGGEATVPAGGVSAGDGGDSPGSDTTPRDADADDWEPPLPPGPPAGTTTLDSGSDAERS